MVLQIGRDSPAGWQLVKSDATVEAAIGDAGPPCCGAQTAEMFRQRATEAVDMIHYLQDFSRTADFSDLAPLFREAEDLDAAAVRASALAMHCRPAS